MTELPQTTLQHLLDQIEQRDFKAFERVYRHYHDRVFAFVLHMHADRADAEEITNDVFFDFGQEFHGLPRPCPVFNLAVGNCQEQGV